VLLLLLLLLLFAPAAQPVPQLRRLRRYYEKIGLTVGGDIQG
jgi:hypothetical protein